MRQSNVKDDMWVRYDHPNSMRHGLIGQVTHAHYTDPRYLPVWFPQVGQAWQCHIRNLEPASEEEIAITVAKEAMGAFKKTQWRDVPSLRSVGRDAREGWDHEEGRA